MALERLQMGQMHLSRVTLLEPYLEAWRHPSHVCGVIWDKIRERCPEGAGLRELHRCFPDYQVWDRSFQGYLQRHKMNREWLRVWQVPFFDRYGGAEQLQILMDNVEDWQRFSRILVLGFDPDMAVWLPLLARRARGIDFYLDYEPRGMEELQEWIGEEYGLVSQWRILESREDLHVWPGSPASGQKVLDSGSELPASGLRVLDSRSELPASGQKVLDSGLEPSASGQKVLDGRQGTPASGQRVSDVEAKPPAIRRRTSDTGPRLFAFGRKKSNTVVELPVTDQRVSDVELEQHTAGQKALDVGRVTPGSPWLGDKAAAEKRRQSYPGLSQYFRGYEEPCLVLDFTGTADIPVTGLRAGSMWWDLGALEEKRHLLEDRPLGVRYVSLRTLWRDLV
ncbi:MAG: hypothetical protein HFH80_06830 [Lachnospiraceae bacterium]|nr:hypothetical protein [Lachnospiraceae bacterium]